MWCSLPECPSSNWSQRRRCPLLSAHRRPSVTAGSHTGHGQRGLRQSSWEGRAAHLPAADLGVVRENGGREAEGLEHWRQVVATRVGEPCIEAVGDSLGHDVHVCTHGGGGGRTESAVRPLKQRCKGSARSHRAVYSVHTFSEHAGCVSGGPLEKLRERCGVDLVLVDMHRPERPTHFFNVVEVTARQKLRTAL